MATTTTYNLEKPTVGGSENSWGTDINDNLDKIDDLLDGTESVDGIDIIGGSIDGTPIGAASASTGAFTTISASGDITGNLKGDIKATDGTVVLNNGADGTDATFSGSSETLTTARAFSVSGDVATSAGVEFNGSGAVDLDVAITNQLFLKIYPVGSVYISTVNTSPATLFGGEWTAIGDGRVLQTVNGSSPSAGANYSENSRSISVENMPAHTHKFTTEKMSAYDDNPNEAGTHLVSDTRDENDEYTFSPTETLRNKNYLTTEGNGTAFDVQQASYGVYMWVRDQ